MMGLSTWGYLQEAALAICVPWPHFCWKSLRNPTRDLDLTR